MFIEVVHINGQYDPATQQHTPPDGAEAIMSRLRRVTDAVVRAGGEALYRMNLGINFSIVARDLGKWGIAKASDPFLSGLEMYDEEARDGRIFVVPDGTLPGYTYGRDPWAQRMCAERTEWAVGNARITAGLEDALASAHRRAFLLGAYTTECVSTYARAIGARNAGVQVYIDPELSVNRSAGTLRPEPGVQFKSLELLLASGKAGADPNG